MHTAELAPAPLYAAVRDLARLVLQRLYRAVIIAMPIVNMMQASIDDVVGMVPMWDRLMPTIGPVNVVPAAVDGLATVGIHVTDFNNMAVAVISMRVMELSVDQVVRMVAVAHDGVSATNAVLVVWVRLGIRACHCFVQVLSASDGATYPSTPFDNPQGCWSSRPIPASLFSFTTQGTGEGFITRCCLPPEWCQQQTSAPPGEITANFELVARNKALP
ncbi:hypothetical protein AVO43_03690 [Microbulbifer sp. ZGT114]|nr:hypothetical protein AVO43_03690 [Microbulbifer sp. ZGT114]